ncbi:hypothetical protein [Vallitalea guaymasensis]|uniref:hypothetical protein n=1 Tax=Vallitalea guaymasensis TaxID=1185412 RepID=UPI001931091B|nr:hypothetical protein [Vallitalea guaymasensis]
MHTISIKSEELTQKESQLKGMASRIENTKDCLFRISNSLDSDIKYRHNIDYELKKLYKDLDNIESQLYKTGDFLKETGKVYHETEIKLELEFNKFSLEITDNYYTNDPNTPLPIMKKEESFFERLGNKLKSGIKHLVDFFTNSNEKVNNETLPYYNDNKSNFVIVNDYLEPDPYMYYTYDTKTYLETRGDWPTWDDVDYSNNEPKKGVLDYLKRSSEQIIKGNYTDEVTLLGTGGQIGLGILGLDALMDMRDIVCDFHKWEWSWGHVKQTALDMAALLPFVGALKYTDEVGTLVKGVNKSSDLIKNIDKTDEIVNGFKTIDKTTDVFNGTVKSVSNIGEFFKDGFGKSIKNKLSKSSLKYDGQSIYKVTSKTSNEYLKKGYGVYLDGLHKDHLEVIDKLGKVKYVLNLDGTLNADKTAKAIGRVIKGW